MTNIEKKKIGLPFFRYVEFENIWVSDNTWVSVPIERIEVKK